jgi:hypothetical protein
MSKIKIKNKINYNRIKKTRYKLIVINIGQQINFKAVCMLKKVVTVYVLCEKSLAKSFSCTKKIVKNRVKGIDLHSSMRVLLFGSKKELKSV